MRRFCQIFETGLSAQSHKQHGCHASAISGYTLAEQKVSMQQLIKVSLLWLYIWLAACQVMGVIDLLLWTAEYQKKKKKYIWCFTAWYKLKNEKISMI